VGPGSVLAAHGFPHGSLATRGSGMWALEHKETGAFIGVVGFAAPEGWPGFELAWTLVRGHWGHGYATEGARTALAYAFTVLDKDCVISLIHPENRASIRVAERIGERLQGRINHLGREMLCYGIDRDVYVAQVAAIAPEVVLLHTFNELSHSIGCLSPTQSPPHPPTIKGP